MLREGGQAVDFRGPVHRAVLERMGIWDAIQERRTTPGALLLVDRDDDVRATLPESMLSGDVEVLRGDLSRILYDRTRGATDYRFSDRIVGIDDRGDSVAVEFAHAPAESFDFVVGADGLHSGVRALAMADEAGVVRHHGYRIEMCIRDRFRAGATARTLRRPVRHDRPRARHRADEPLVGQSTQRVRSRRQCHLPLARKRACRRHTIARTQLPGLDPYAQRLGDALIGRRATIVQHREHSSLY